MTIQPMLASFAGNSTWFGVLISLHIAGAVIGLGPTYTFGLMANMAKAGGPPALTIMKVMNMLEHKLVVPILAGVQGTTGVLMIFNRRLNEGFFSHNNGWLIGALVAYIAALGIATGVDGPARKKAIVMAEAGQAGTPEFNKLIALQQKLGPLLGVLGTAILVLMIWKPGSGCSPPGRC